MATLNYQSRRLYGPFHRLLAHNVQDATTVLKQVTSGEIWGKRPSYGGSPAVKAYPGRLPTDGLGIEFWSFQPPDAPYGPRAFWRTPGTWVSVDDEAETVVLSVAFVRVSQAIGTFAP